MTGRFADFVARLRRPATPAGIVAASSELPLQRRFADLTAKLQLSPDLLLQGETPSGVNRQRIADVLEDTMSRLGWSDEPRLKRRQQLDVTFAAAERLISLNALADAEHVSRAAHPKWADTLKMIRIRLSALLQMENADRLEAELRRQELRIEQEPKLRAVLSGLRSKPEFQLLLARERFAQITTLLGLSRSFLLEGEAPEGIDRERIGIALADSVEKFGLGGNPRLTPEQQLDAVVDAAQTLNHRRAYLEAAHVSKLANPQWADTPAMIGVRLHALLAARERSRMLAEIARLSSGPAQLEGGDEVLRRFLQSPSVFRLLPNLLDYHDLLWGELKPNLLEKISDLRREPGYLAHLDPNLESNLWALRSAGTKPDFDFIAELRWGATAYFYFIYLWACNARLVAEPTNSIIGTDRTETIRSLARQAQAMIRVTDPSMLNHAVAAGCTILLCHAHAGMMVGSAAVARCVDLPLATVAGGPAVFTERQIQVDATAPDAPQQFLKLIKTVRKAQWFVTVVPDGALGDTVCCELSGRKIAIGKGAALIALKAHAATFFARSVWTGQGFEVELSQGPTASADCDPETFAEEFHTFYVGQIARILQGEPVDMAPLGGFWNAFA